MAWEITDHVCRRCMGRVLKQIDTEGAERHRCSNCGAENIGYVDEVCCCGMKTREVVKGGEIVQMSRPVGLRCAVNPAPTPQYPSEVIAVAEDVS